VMLYLSFFFSSRRRHTRSKRDWSSDVCSPDLAGNVGRVRDDELGTTGKPQGVEKFQVADVALHEADIQLFAEQTCPAEIGEVLLPQLHGRRIQLDAGHLNRAQPAVVGAAVRKL